MEESASSLKFLVDKVSFVNKVPVLKKATSDDETPTPGYLYQEVCDFTLEKGSYCQDMLEYLVNRLNNKSFHIKLKVIRVLRFIVENGHPEFKQGLRRKSGGIKEATKFSGPPDPLHGLTPYVMVRKEAEELSRILFEIGADDGDVPANLKQRSRGHMSQGLGNASGTGMQGFGNNPLKQPSLSDSIVDGLRNLAEKVIEPSSASRTSNRDLTETKFAAYKPVNMDLGVMETGSTSSQGPVTPPLMARRPAPPTHRAEKVHKPGVAGGGWDDPDDLDEENIDPHQGHSRRSTPSVDSGNSSDKAESVTQGSWKAEEQLVGGTLEGARGNPRLSRQQIAAFVKSCSSLNCAKTVEMVDTVLRSHQPDSQETLKAMQLVEKLLQTDLVLPDEIGSRCCASLLDIYKAETGANGSKARKILRILEKLTTNERDIFAELNRVQRSHGNKETPAQSRDITDVASFGQILNEAARETSNADLSFIKAPFAPSAADDILRNHHDMAGNQEMQATCEESPAARGAGVDGAGVRDDGMPQIRRALSCDSLEEVKEEVTSRTPDPPSGGNEAPRDVSPANKNSAFSFLYQKEL